jgi:hypothetical protein
MSTRPENEQYEFNRGHSVIHREGNLVYRTDAGLCRGMNKFRTLPEAIAWYDSMVRIAIEHGDTRR